MVGRGLGAAPDVSNAQLVDQLDRLDGVVNGKTEMVDVVEGLRSLGLRADHRTGAELAWLRESLARGSLAVVLGDAYRLPQAAPTTNSAGHFVTIAGLSKGGGFVVHDPWSEPGFSRIYTLTDAQLRRFIDGRLDGGIAIAERRPPDSRQIQVRLGDTREPR